MADRQTEVRNFARTLTTTVMGPSDTSVNVDTSNGMPPASSILVIEPESASRREVVLFDQAHGATVLSTSTLDNRYLAGSAEASGITHPEGSVIISAPLAQHVDDLNDRTDVVVTGLAGKVAKAGDTMTGALTLPGDAVADLEAVPKQQLDGKVTKAGDTMTGALVLPGDPTAPLHAAPKQYVDAKIDATTPKVLDAVEGATGSIIDIAIPAEYQGRSGYVELVVTLGNTSKSDVHFLVQLSDDGGATFYSGADDYSFAAREQRGPDAPFLHGGTADAVRVSGAQTARGGEPAGPGRITLASPDRPALTCEFQTILEAIGIRPAVYYVGSAYLNVATTPTTLRLMLSEGNFQALDYALLGYRW